MKVCSNQYQSVVSSVHYTLPHIISNHSTRQACKELNQSNKIDIYELYLTLINKENEQTPLSSIINSQ